MNRRTIIQSIPAVILSFFGFGKAEAKEERQEIGWIVRLIGTPNNNIWAVFCRSIGETTAKERASNCVLSLKSAGYDVEMFPVYMFASEKEQSWAVR